MKIPVASIPLGTFEATFSSKILVLLLSSIYYLVAASLLGFIIEVVNNTYITVNNPKKPIIIPIER